MCDTEIVPVTSANLEFSIAAACQIFKECDHFAIRQEFTDSVFYKTSNVVHDTMNIDRSSYFTIQENGEVLGVSGYYTYHQTERDAWLGWTGVLPKAQGRGVGELLVNSAQSIAYSDINSLQNFRIWTSEEEKHQSAIRLYRRLGFLEENYLDSDVVHEPGASLVRIFSKSVSPKQNTLPWHQSNYLLPDLEKFDMPRLNQLCSGRISCAA